MCGIAPLLSELPSVNFLVPAHHYARVTGCRTSFGENFCVSSASVNIVTELTSAQGEPEAPAAVPYDGVVLGQRLRHSRRARGLTLAQTAEAVGTVPSALSMIENGRREPKLSLLQALARTLDAPLEDLLRPAAPSR